MQPIPIIVLALLAGVPLGLWLRRSLATLSYRTTSEFGLPVPGPRWWVVWVTILAVDSLAIAAVLSRNPLVYISLVPLTATGPWLAAVDFDVLRIPNRVLAPTALATLLAVVGIAAAVREWRMLLAPIAAALATGAIFAAVHFATRGNIGFGDVKLAAVVSLAVGPLGVRAVWLSILASSLIALLWKRTTRRIGPIPFGPWILCSAEVAALAGAASI